MVCWGNMYIGRSRLVGLSGDQGSSSQAGLAGIPSQIVRCNEQSGNRQKPMLVVRWLSHISSSLDLQELATFSSQELSLRQ